MFRGQQQKKNFLCTLTVSRSDSELLADVTVQRDVWLEEEEVGFWVRFLVSCLFARWPGWLPAALRMIM